MKPEQLTQEILLAMKYRRSNPRVSYFSMEKVPESDEQVILQTLKANWEKLREDFKKERFK